MLEAGCFAHARRKFFKLADVAGGARRKGRGDYTRLIYPIAIETAQRIDDLFDVERATNGKDAAERLAVRRELSAPLGRKAWLFCGSDRGDQRAAVLYTVIQTAHLNDIDPQAWLADVLAHIAGRPIRHVDELLPWNCRQQSRARLAAGRAGAEVTPKVSATPVWLGFIDAGFPSRERSFVPFHRDTNGPAIPFDRGTPASPMIRS